MRKLVIVRHGDYNPDRTLSEHGVAQMRHLAGRLKPIINGDPTILLASTAPRASASGVVLADELGCPREDHLILWSDNDHRQDPKAAYELIRTKATENNTTVIVVTHMEYIESLPWYIGREVLSGVSFPNREIPKGEAWLIDFARRSCERVP